MFASLKVSRLRGVLTSRQADESVHSLSIPVLVFREGVKYLRPALGVAHHRDFWFSSDFPNFLNEGWNVVLAHLRPCEVPVIPKSPYWLAVVLMHVAVQSASVVPQPHIVATLSQLTRQRRARNPFDPVVAAVGSSMLHQNWRFHLSLWLGQ